MPKLTYVGETVTVRIDYKDAAGVALDVSGFTVETKALVPELGGATLHDMTLDGSSDLSVGVGLYTLNLSVAAPNAVKGRIRVQSKYSNGGEVYYTDVVTIDIAQPLF